MPSCKKIRNMTKNDRRFSGQDSKITFMDKQDSRQSPCVFHGKRYDKY